VLGIYYITSGVELYQNGFTKTVPLIWFFLKEKHGLSHPPDPVIVACNPTDPWHLLCSSATGIRFGFNPFDLSSALDEAHRATFCSATIHLVRASIN
jgi:hypothetical protein